MEGQPVVRRTQRRGIPKSFWVRAVYSFILIATVVLLGTVAMHAIEGWSYLDSFYFTSFIATGQGPPGNLQPGSSLGKVFSSVLAFVSVGTVITALLFLFGPFLGRVLKAGEERLEEVGREVEGLERHGRKDE
jgi:voltage-gated potassium channel